MNKLLLTEPNTNAIDRNHDWQNVFGNAPPKYLSDDFQQSILIWEKQAREQGGVSREVQSALKNAHNCRVTISTGELKPGVTLVREWNGRTYQVNVDDNAFVMDGKRYKSLSAIARKITGAKWSGLRFFGLNTKKGVEHA